ncbi:hypothetical protein ABIB68_007309 [Bradyrhizobium sp. F1.2.2]
MTSLRRVLISDPVHKSTASHTHTHTHRARKRSAEINYKIVNDRCRMIQKGAKLRSVGRVTGVARFTPERRIGNPSVYRKSVAS